MGHIWKGDKFESDHNVLYTLEMKIAKSVTKIGLKASMFAVNFLKPEAVKKETAWKFPNGKEIHAFKASDLLSVKCFDTFLKFRVNGLEIA